MSRHENTRGLLGGFLTRRRRQVALVSGGFDPIHSGHVRLVLEAARHGEVWVILNSDPWLVRKKGRPFMDWSERAAVASAIRGVARVVRAKDDDGTVAASIREIVTMERIHGPPTDFTFCNGGDRTEDTTPEHAACLELGVAMAWGIGGGKVQSSSELLERWLSSPEK